MVKQARLNQFISNITSNIISITLNSVFVFLVVAFFAAFYGRVKYSSKIFVLSFCIAFLLYSVRFLCNKKWMRVLGILVSVICAVAFASNTMFMTILLIMIVFLSKGVFLGTKDSDTALGEGLIAKVIVIFVANCFALWYVKYHMKNVFLLATFDCALLWLVQLYQKGRMRFYQSNHRMDEKDMRQEQSAQKESGIKGVQSEVSHKMQRYVIMTWLGAMIVVYLLLRATVITPSEKLMKGGFDMLWHVGEELVASSTEATTEEQSPFWTEEKYVELPEEEEEEEEDDTIEQLILFGQSILFAGLFVLFLGWSLYKQSNKMKAQGTMKQNEATQSTTKIEKCKRKKESLFAPENRIRRQYKKQVKAYLKTVSKQQTCEDIQEEIRQQTGESIDQLTKEYSAVRYGIYDS